MSSPVGQRSRTGPNGSAPHSEPEELIAGGHCHRAGPDGRFPELARSSTAFGRACPRCPLLAECLEIALAEDDRFGIWGKPARTYPQTRERALTSTKNAERKPA